MPSKFGGIPLGEPEEGGVSEFGGVAVDYQEQPPQEPETEPTIEPQLIVPKARTWEEEADFIRNQFETGQFDENQQAAFREIERRGLLSKPFSVAGLTPVPEKLEAPTPEMDFIKPMSWKSVMSQAVSNTPKSAAQFVEDLVSPFLHPIDTAKAVGNLAVGMKDKFVPGTQESEQIVDDLIEVFKERYGGIENLKTTLAEDPVGITADIASVLVPGGVAVKGAGTAAKVGKIAKVGEAVSRIGKAIEPVSAVAKAAKEVGRKLIPKDAPSSWYQGAAKFSTTIPEAGRAKLAQTALDKGIMPTLSGLDKTRDMINKFNDEITILIDEATDAGKKIQVQKLFKEFTTLKNKMSSEPLTRKKQISRVAREINFNFKKLGKKDITPAEAQRLKQAIYKETEGFYSSVKNSPAKIEAKHAVARAAKESIEEIFPEIKNLNKQEGALIELKKQLEKSASRISNRDLIGIGVPIKGGAGGAVAGPAGMAGGLILGLFDTPQVKAKLAIVANRLKKKGVILDDDSLMRKIIETTTPAIPLRQAGRLERQETPTK